MPRDWNEHNDYCAGKAYGVKPISYDADLQKYTYSYQPSKQNESSSNGMRRSNTVGRSNSPVASRIRSSLISTIRSRRNTTASAAGYHEITANESSRRTPSRSPRTSTSSQSSRDSLQQPRRSSRPPPYSDRYRNSREEPLPPPYEGRRRRFTTFEQLNDHRMIVSPHRDAEEYESQGQSVLGRLGRRLSTRRAPNQLPARERFSMQPEPRVNGRTHERTNRNRNSTDRSPPRRVAAEQESVSGEGMLAKIGRALSVRKNKTNGVYRRATVSGRTAAGSSRQPWV
jgi:hypothetical protein